MTVRPKDLLQATRPGDAQPSTDGTVGVFVVLKERPDPAVERRLSALGLQVREVIGNKMVGSISSHQVGALRADPAVAEVETSTRVRPHG